jgi:hypothetical protein
MCELGKGSNQLLLIKTHVSLHYVIHQIPEYMHHNWTSVDDLVPTLILFVFQLVLYLNFVDET